MAHCASSLEIMFIAIKMHKINTTGMLAVCFNRRGGKKKGKDYETDLQNEKPTPSPWHWDPLALCFTGCSGHFPIPPQSAAMPRDGYDHNLSQ